MVAPASIGLLPVQRTSRAGAVSAAHTRSAPTASSEATPLIPSGAEGASAPSPQHAIAPSFVSTHVRSPPAAIACATGGGEDGCAAGPPQHFTCPAKRAHVW